MTTAGEHSPVVVLLEGDSDVAAVRTLRSRKGIRPEHEPCRLVAMGGATNIRRHLGVLAELPVRPRVLGLCDEGEAGFFVRALERYAAPLGLAGTPTADTLPELGFQVCRRDLEDELMRALGVGGVRAVLGDLGLDGSFEAFRRQQAWVGRPVEAQLRRFATTTSGRKELLAEAMAAAVPDGRWPAPPRSSPRCRTERHSPTARQCPTPRRSPAEADRRPYLGRWVGRVIRGPRRGRIAPLSSRSRCTR
ncbi:hypothetical protein BCF74_12124 [Knoellia remsis]|uniref:OLD protein-like TOPRIM domain-containing protein n=1 Tax=Knoellia remsis TaxID=407159 RepID=A0A2T0UDG2_9MICO|nr:TOPRIM nucleotidyl transferase/hydrolase domain-containing protein [Knoellia remsis]PRY55847.1 hypothetical protein BCF74_12124 [Knoellia remsis]